MAFFCSLLLLFTFVKTFFWFAERQVRRQMYYECTRGVAGRQTIGQALVQDSVVWNKIYEGCAYPRNPGPLEILVRDGRP